MEHLDADRLVPGRQINNAEARVAQRNATVGGDPMPLTIRTAVTETLGGPLRYLCRDWLVTREESDNSAHGDALLGFSFFWGLTGALIISSAVELVCATRLLGRSAYRG